MPAPTLADLADSLGPEVRVSSMFGKPTLKDAAGKAFACLLNDELACRLGKDTDLHATALSLAGAHLFDPSGRDRPMKDWVSIPNAYSDQWATFAAAALSTPR